MWRIDRATCSAHAHYAAQLIRHVCSFIRLQKAHTGMNGVYTWFHRVCRIINLDETEYTQSFIPRDMASLKTYICHMAGNCPHNRRTVASHVGNGSLQLGRVTGNGGSEASVHHPNDSGSISIVGCSMVHQNVKGAALHVDPKDVSPAWKVLQMKLKEESLCSQDFVKDDRGTGQSAISKTKKSRKRRFEEAVNGVDMDEPSAKRNADIPVLIHDNTRGDVTQIVALDCEYVGGGTDGSDDLLARVSIVNESGHIVYDTYVKPKESITDFRTSVSGIRPADVAKGLPFGVVQKEVAKILKDRIVVGHALNNDFRVLSFHHNSRLTRDTAKCHLLRKMANCNGIPSLKKLAHEILGINIQQGEHDSVVDARVALRLYMAVKKKWESDIKRYRR